jgi:hypothetical protein
VTYVLHQTAVARAEIPPIPGSFSCDVLAQQAKQAGILVSNSEIRRRVFQDGCFIFLVRRTSTDWTHTGFGYAMDSNGAFRTIEGNTNDDGSREGYEVCTRIRSSRNMDFILL